MVLETVALTVFFMLVGVPTVLLGIFLIYVYSSEQGRLEWRITKLDRERLSIETHDARAAVEQELKEERERLVALKIRKRIEKDQKKVNRLLKNKKKDDEDD